MGPVRFWRWFRTIPILTMALVAGLTFGQFELPGNLVRQFLLTIDYREQILDSSARHGVDPLLVCSIIRCESGWDVQAASAAGAVGLMQVMPSTSAELAEQGLVDAGTYDPNNLTDPATNIEYGSAYLQQLYSLLGSTDAVIAAYNAGPGSVESWLSGGGDISEAIGYPETAIYLARVKESYKRYQQFYTETLEER